MALRSSLDRGLNLIIGGLFEALRPAFPPAVRIEATNHCSFV